MQKVEGSSPFIRSSRTRFVAMDRYSPLPDVRLEILPGAAHRPDIQAPERINEPLARFLLG